MNDYESAVNVPETSAAGAMIGYGRGPKGMNPTLRENIDLKIQHYKDEIVRLEAIKEKVPNLLDVNLRDLREAMQF